MAKTKAELMAEKMAKQRLAQEAFEAGKTPAVEIEVKEPAQKPVKTAQEPRKEVKTTQDTTKPKKPTQAEIEPSVSMVDKIIGKRKKSKKITFSTYGDEELVKILDEDAAERGVSRSYLVNQILNEIYKSKRK